MFMYNCKLIRLHLHTHTHTHTHTQILPTAEEVLPAVLYFIEQTVAKPILYSPSVSTKNKNSLHNIVAGFLKEFVAGADNKQ